MLERVNCRGRSRLGATTEFSVLLRLCMLIGSKINRDIAVLLAVKNAEKPS